MPRGHFPRSDEHRANISKALKGKKKNPDHVEKNRLAQVGKITSDEARRKIGDAHRGRKRPPRTEEWSARLRDANKGRSGLLAKYGISTDEYAQQISTGKRWCYWRKHWDDGTGFIRKIAVCGGCRREYNRAMNLKRIFGIDGDWYDAKLSDQGGVCAICDSANPQNKGMKFFAVDHDHVTSRIRGLLCSKCNGALERFEKFPDWGNRAIAYLAHYQATADALPKAPAPHKKYIRPSKRVHKYVPAGGFKDDDTIKGESNVLS